jgi:uncharacterized delta-60 repeat protein
MMLKQLWRGALIATLLILIGTTFPIAQAAPSDLDRSFAGFGAAGKVILPGLNMPGNYGGMALAPDGKIVMVGFNTTHLLVWRYLPNGQPDPSFGAAGLYAYPPTGFDTIPTDVAVQPDGKIVIVGRNRFAYYQGASDFLVMRVLADGSNLDFSFAGNGFLFSSVEKPLSALITISRSRVTAPAATPTPALTTMARRRLTSKVTALRMPSPGRTMESWCWPARARPLPANLLCCA